MHEYEVHYCETHITKEVMNWDAIATPKPCPCSHLHFYNEFNERLKRFHPDLQLAFDIKLGRWLIIRWTPETVHLDTGSESLKVGYVHRFLTILMDMKWVFNEVQKDGSNKYVTHPRQPGDWVFAKLKKWKAAQFMGRPDWVRDAMLDQRKEEEEKSNAELRSFTKDWIDDCLSIADSGNPEFVRTAVRVDEKAKAFTSKRKARKKKEPVAV